MWLLNVDSAQALPQKVNKASACNQVTGELCKNVLLLHVPCSRGSQTNVNALAYCDKN